MPNTASTTTVYDRCPTCNRFDWTRGHKCPPKWAIWNTDDLGSDPSSNYAPNATDAAEQYAAEYDNGEYGLMRGEELTVVVVEYKTWLHQDFETEAEFDTWIATQPRYLCTGEAVPEYHAKPIKTETIPE
jgi:hypothetical protein